MAPGMLLLRNQAGTVFSAVDNIDRDEKALAAAAAAELSPRLCQGSTRAP